MAFSYQKLPQTLECAFKKLLSKKRVSVVQGQQNIKLAYHAGHVINNDLIITATENYKIPCRCWFE